MNRETTEAQIMQPPPGPLRYGQPVVQPAIVTPAPIVVNQQNPEIRVGPQDFKVVPVTITCQFCKRTITTQVTKSLDVCACLLCYCTCIVFYVCVQAIRNKDLCCWNAEHRCPFCGNVVGAYTSC